MKPVIGLNGEIELEKGGPGSGPRPGEGSTPGQNGGLKFQLRQASSTKEYAVFETDEAGKNRIAFTSMDKKEAQDRLNYLEQQEAKFQSKTTHENPFSQENVSRLIKGKRKSR